MRQILHASFSNPDLAARAVGALLDHGVDARDVSVYAHELPAHWSETTMDSESVEKVATNGITVTTGQDAAVGAAKGAGVGLGVGALAAIASLAVPGVGMVIGGGALATAIAGAAGATAAGAVAGGAMGYLQDQGVMPEHVEAINANLVSGGALVSVSVPSNNVNADTVQQIFAKYESLGTHAHEEPIYENPTYEDLRSSDPVIR